MKLIIFTICILETAYTIADDCLKRDYGQGSVVCVCNEQYCDTMPPIKAPPTPNVAIYTSNKGGKRFAQTYATFRAASELRDGFLDDDCKWKYTKDYDGCDRQSTTNFIKEYGQSHKSSEINKNRIKRILIDQKRIYQRIIGWGGAFTDATGINVKSLRGDLQEKLLRSYFADDGLEYNLCRVPIGGTDFSTHGYTYVDRLDDGDFCEDPLLTKFKLAKEDYMYKIPLIHEAKALRPNLLLFGSAWTAPKWMKESLDYIGRFGYVKRRMYQPWANYYIKFLDSYSFNNITFWGITSGNEIFFNMAQEKIPGTLWTPNEITTWIRNYLGPALKRSQYYDIKLMTIDDVRPTLPHSVDTIFADSYNQQYIDGIAIHWYFDNDNNSYILDEVHNQYPDKFLLYSEACTGAFDNTVHLGSWGRGEAYAKNIIEVMNRWVTAWTDWNMVLNTQGGPTYINNFVDSPVIVNATAQEFYKQPMYYALGHFSKFVPRDSVRIHSSQCDPDIEVAAFKRPDGGVAVVILNPTDLPQKRIVWDERRGEIQLELSPRSITTLLYY